MFAIQMAARSTPTSATPATPHLSSQSAQPRTLSSPQPPSRLSPPSRRLLLLLTPMSAHRRSSAPPQCQRLLLPEAAAEVAAGPSPAAPQRLQKAPQPPRSLARCHLISRPVIWWLPPSICHALRLSSPARAVAGHSISRRPRMGQQPIRLLPTISSTRPPARSGHRRPSLVDRPASARPTAV